MDDGAKVTLDGNLPDRAIFDPQDWQLTDFEADLCAETRRLAQSKFAARASIIDREARFPTENYADLREAGLLGSVFRPSMAAAAPTCAPICWRLPRSGAIAGRRR